MRACRRLRVQQLTLYRRHEILEADGPLILPPSDKRSQQVASVVTKLVTALEEQDHLVVCGATWPPRSQELGNVMSDREHGYNRRGVAERYQPSATASSTYIPWRPASSNPLKKLETADWDLYVVDSVGYARRQ